jgi:hypothetical protein
VEDVRRQAQRQGGNKPELVGMPGQADLKVNGVLWEMPEVGLQLVNLLLEFGLQLAVGPDVLGNQMPF